MSLEQFKTQVLLLHSEQGTLDELSAGFNDRYTVHCATSGSEALSTLGEVPIHVLITTRELPGMSGVDALREAKRRSPDTIGVLIAGSDDGDNLEALAGDHEIFQIIRGDVTAESLRGLIDDATRQARLLTLAESANDATVNVDVPIGDNVAEETSAHGSTVGGDGTGQTPVLDSKSAAANTSVVANSVDVLVLTRDDEFMSALNESARGTHNVWHANTISEADEAVGKHNIGVVVIDAAMVGSNVEKMTLHLRQIVPRIVSIVAGRRDDGEMLMDLINRGKVYRFLLKPVSPGRARLAVEASLKHHVDAPDSAFKIPGNAHESAATSRSDISSTPGLDKDSENQPQGGIETTPEAESHLGTHASPRVLSDMTSPTDNRIAEATGITDSCFAETLAGIVNSVGENISSGMRNDVNKPAAPVSAADSGGSLIQKPAVLGIGAVILIAGLSGVWWIFSDSDRPAAEAQRAVAATPPAQSMQAGQTGVATVDGIPIVDSSNSTSGVEYLLEDAESALLEMRLEDAALTLQQVSLTDPDNARLPFLNAQLEQAQLRDYLASARIAIRESRLEDATTALNSARALGIEDAADIEVVADEISIALDSQRLDEVIARGNISLKDGNLIAPSNDNARYYFEVALSMDPQSAAARQGLIAVASKIVLQARTEIDAHNFNAADALLIDARRLDPTSSDLADATAALRTARDRIEKQQLAAQRATQKAEAERIAAQKAEAERIATEKAEAERIATEKAEAERIAAQKAEAEQVAAETAETQRLAAEKAQADGLTANATDVGQTAAQRSAIEADAAMPVPVSSLTRTKYVAPKYPRSAQRRDISGWVDVVFTVDIDGSVIDIDVRDSNPGDVFVKSAMDAVEDWKFEPVFENGVAVEKLAAVRMLFAIE